MNRDDFWNIVERVHCKSDEIMDRKCELLSSELERLSPSEIADWYRHFDDLLRESYSYDVWAAAYTYGEGCSDDGFLDFRSSLVSCGRQLYEEVLRDPDSLADYHGNTYLIYEGYQYVAPDVYERLTGRDIPTEEYPDQEPSGTDWKPEDLSKRFPRMTDRYDFR